jgi:hypothetical protein
MIKIIPRRNMSEIRDYMQKSGCFTNSEELSILGLEETYYKVIERESKAQGFIGYRIV